MIQELCLRMTNFFHCRKERCSYLQVDETRYTNQSGYLIFLIAVIGVDYYEFTSQYNLIML